MTRKRQNKKLKAPRNQGFELVEHPINQIDKTALKEALIAGARESQTKFPELIKSLIGHFRVSSPLHIISTVATYGLQAAVTDNGVSAKSLIEEVGQHHVELLQALALTLNVSEWGESPASPSVVQAVIDGIKELTDAFTGIRHLAMEQELDDQARTVLSLQERLRGHTQVVRNWGYFSSVVQISRELYSPLDGGLQLHFGFGATDLIDVVKTWLNIFESRANERWKILSKIFRSRKIPELVRKYYAQYPGVYGDPEEFLRRVPGDATFEMVKLKLLSHADLSLALMAQVDVDELAEKSDRSVEVVRLVLQQLSIQPGSLDFAGVERFFLSNPVWIAPGMKIEDNFFFTAPQVVFSHIHGLMRSLVDAAGLQDKLKKRRAVYLESKIQETVERILPNAKLSLNVKWGIGEDVFETDLLGQIDRVVLIVEAKSAALTPQGLRGAPDRVKRHVRDLVVAPAEQSYRLEQVIRQAKNGNAESLEITRKLGFDAESVDTIVRISVTLDDFSVISSAEGELKEAGWAPENLRLAPTLNIADFGCVVDILKEPVYFFHYFAERERTQKTMKILGDELDFLGFYLETGFNAAGIEKQNVRLSISGMSRAIDHYFSSADAGVRVRKPRPKLHPYVERLVLGVQRKANGSWTTVALDLLRMGSFDEQTCIAQALEQLRKRVRKNYRDPEHLSSLIVSPPESRESGVIFYVYPRVLADRRRETVQKLAGIALEEQGRRRCVVVSREIETWEQYPYQAIAIASLPRDEHRD